MRLSKVHVLNYKCVLDSDWFTVGDLTCLVGKNESGKTAVLEGLEKLNSVQPARADFEDTHYPRVNWSEYEQSEVVDTGLETEWILDQEEIDYINGLAGDVVLTKTSVTVSKDYENGN